MPLWHSAPGECPGGSEIETCIPVDRPVPSSGRITWSELPAGKLASNVHQGPYDGMDAALDSVWGCGCGAIPARLQGHPAMSSSLAPGTPAILRTTEPRSLGPASRRVAGGEGR